MTQNNRLLGIFSVVLILLLVPFIAMQFTEEVKWTPFDFLVAGGLLSGFGLLIELVLRYVERTNFRIIILFAILTFLILIWLELAVGIFGSPIAGS
jgi:hypothetical protein